MSIVVTSGHALPDSIGDDRLIYLQKPYELSDLIQVVGTAAAAV